MAVIDYELARSFWPDAPLDDDVLEVVLDAAYRSCLAFAPTEAYLPSSDEDLTTSAQTMAVVMQARAIYRSVTSGSGDSFGAEGLTVTVFPLDWSVKQMLRPQTRPVVG